MLKGKLQWVNCLKFFSDFQVSQPHRTLAFHPNKTFPQFSFKGPRPAPLHMSPYMSEVSELLVGIRLRDLIISWRSSNHVT